MATFKTAYHKLMYRPIELDQSDLEALKCRDPELAAAAYEAYRRALRMEYRKNSGILPVVRLERSK
jgi:hypothetical protein